MIHGSVYLIASELAGARLAGLTAGGAAWLARDLDPELIPPRTSPIRYSEGYRRSGPVDRVPLEWPRFELVRPFYLASEQRRLNTDS